MSQIDLDSDFLNYIVSAGFQPGDRLPTISQLKTEEHLNISVSKIREQLEVARAMGLVEVKSKTGMHLKSFNFSPAVRLSLLYALAQDINCFEQFGSLRVHMETAYWNEACKRLLPEDRDEMRAYVDSAKAKLAEGQWIQIPHQEHRAFHMAVFKRLENPFVYGLLEAYWDAYEAVELNRYADYSYLQQVWAYHERILDAICAAEYESARTIFTEHTQLLRHQPRMKNIAPDEQES